MMAGAARPAQSRLTVRRRSVLIHRAAPLARFYFTSVRSTPVFAGYLCREPYSERPSGDSAISVETALSDVETVSGPAVLRW